MAIQYSIQKMVSDGTLSTIVLGIQYLQRNDIYIRIAGEETPQSGAPSGYTWSFLDNTTLKILPVVPNGVEVVVYRRTDIDAMYNIYSQNAQFDEATIDENNQQLLYIAQEYLEQGIPGAGVDTIEFIRDDGSFTYYRIKRTDGSYSDEFYVPSAGSITKVLAREALRRSYAEAGLDMVDGSFETGGTVANATEVLLYEADGKAYGWGGAYPKAVPESSTPATSGGVGVGAWANKSEVYGQISFNTVTDMLSSGLLHVGQKAMTLAYNQPVIQHWEVVASGSALITDAYPASDLTLKTQSGLWVKNVSDNLDQRHFGTYGDVNEITKVGTPDTDAIRAYAAYIKANKISSMNFSAGKVFFGLAGNNEIDLTGLDFDLNITGKFLATRFIRGNGAVTSRYARLFTIENEPGTTISVNIDGFYVDDNAAGNPLSGSNQFEFQGAHVFGVFPQGYRGIDTCSYANIRGRDIIADLCNCSGNSINTVRVYAAHNINVPERTRVRFDVGLTCSYDHFMASDCDVVNFEIETNSVSSLDRGFTKLSSVKAHSLDLMFKSTVSSKIPVLQTVNCTASLLYVDGYDWTDFGGNFKLQAPFRFVGSGTGVEVNVVLNGTRMVKDAASYTTNGNAFLHILTAVTSPKSVSFVGDFLVDSGDQMLFQDVNAALAGKVVSFKGGTLKSTAVNPVDFRSGNFEFEDLDLYGSGAGDAILHQHDTTSAASENRFKVHNVRIKTNNYMLTLSSGTAARSLDFKDNEPYTPALAYENVRADKLVPPWGTGSEITVKNLDTLTITGGIPTSGNFIRGNKFKYLDFTGGGYVGAACVETGAASSTRIKGYGQIA